MIAATLPPLAPEQPPLPLAERVVHGLVVLLIHGVLAYGLLYASVRNDLVQLPASLSVRLLPMLEDKNPHVPPPPPPIPVRKATVQPLPPLPVLAARAPAEAPGSFVVAPQPPVSPVAVPIVAAPPPPAPITAPRFDADYLHNPKPVYPAMARRNGEEGKVLLRVRVSPEGLALEVAVRQGSGFARLDEAARDAVSRWRFVPARRGDENIESWVVVPITFALD